MGEDGAIGEEVREGLVGPELLGFHEVVVDLLCGRICDVSFVCHSY